MIVDVCGNCPVARSVDTLFTLSPASSDTKPNARATGKRHPGHHDSRHQAQPEQQGDRSNDAASTYAHTHTSLTGRTSTTTA